MDNPPNANTTYNQPSSGNVISQQERASIIKEMKTPLQLSSLVVLILEGLFLVELMQTQRYISTDKSHYVILGFVVVLFLFVLMAWVFTERAGRRVEEAAVRAAKEAAIAAAQVAKKEYYFTGLVTRRRGLKDTAGLPGAKVTLWKNGQSMQVMQTLGMGETAFHLPVEENDEVKVRVDYDGMTGREMFLITAPFQHKFTVELI